MVGETGTAAKSNDRGPDAKVARTEKPLRLELAALLYYDQQKKGSPGTGVVLFESIEDVEQKKFLAHADKVLLMLDQLNQMVVSRVDPQETFAQRVGNKEKVLQTIRAFLPRVTKPAKVARFFPAEELAIWIVEGRVK